MSIASTWEVVELGLETVGEGEESPLGLEHGPDGRLQGWFLHKHKNLNLLLVIIFISVFAYITIYFKKKDIFRQFKPVLLIRICFNAMLIQIQGFDEQKL